MLSRSKIHAAVGASIRKNRKRAGLTQKVVAKKARLHPNYFGRVERGEESVSILALWRIAKALGVRASDLLRGCR
jgi:transcriptional regulator with XRE-family HTH domain